MTISLTTTPTKRGRELKRKKPVPSLPPHSRKLAGKEGGKRKTKRIVFHKETMQRVALFSIALALVAFADVNEEGGKQVQEYAAVIDRIPSWLASVEVTRRDLENWEADHRPLPPSPKPGPWRTTFGKDFGVIPDTGRPFRVLFVSELEVYVTSMSRWYFHAFVSSFLLSLHSRAFTPLTLARIPRRR